MVNNTVNVGIADCCSYNQDEVYSTVEKICSVCNFPDVKDKSVLIKPNILSDAKPEDCITTNPEVVRSVIRLVKEKGAATVYCGDSPGLHNQNFCGRNCGIYDICQQEGAIWCDFTDKPTTVKIDGTKQKLPMAHIALESDVVISVCKFKTHQLMYATGAVKNLFGTIPGINKGSCHFTNPSRESFARLIVGIHETVKPDFCIMDAVIGMEGPGPANGYPRAVNLMLASESCFALDVAEATIMGYSQNDLPILNEARRRHLVPSTIEYPLLKANDLVIEDFKRIKVSKKEACLFRKLIIPFCSRGIQKLKQQKETPPSFNHDRCIRCKRCVNICPAKALTLSEENKIEIDKSKCIRCYCCHEMCPADAITIKGDRQ